MLKPLALALLFASSTLQAMDPKGALACLQALPEGYRNGVLKLSADNANPNPDTWYVSAQVGRDDKGMRSIEVASGQIISDKATLGLREIFSSAKPLDLSKVQLDSREIFDIAQQYAGANGKHGEIGGPDEAEAARWCKLNMKKPIVGFIAGVTAPAGKRMGHAGALISGGADTADAKLAVMEECGFKVTRNPSEMAKLLKALL